MKKTKSKFEKIVKILCAMLLAAIQIVGYSFSKQNNWNLVIKDGRISGKAIVIWAIGSILVYACISFIYLILDRMMDARLHINSWYYWHWSFCYVGCRT